MNPIKQINDYVNVNYSEQMVLRCWIKRLSSENFCACMHSKFIVKASDHTKNSLVVVLQDTEGVFVDKPSFDKLYTGIALEMVGFEKNDKMYRNKKDGKYHSSFFIRPIWEIKRISELMVYPNEPICISDLEPQCGLASKMSLENKVFLDLQPGTTIDNDQLISILQEYRAKRSNLWKQYILNAYDMIDSVIKTEVDGTWITR